MRIPEKLNRLDSRRQEETVRIGGESSSQHPLRVLCSRYELLREIGHGSWGVVYLCNDTFSKDVVAVKALPPELTDTPFGVADLEARCEKAMKLRHPGIASVRGLERDYAHLNYYLIEEFVDGDHLERHYREAKRSIPISEVLDLAEQLSSALDYAHAAGVLHRDIKPSNIQRTPEGRFRFLDFGVSSPLQQSIEQLERLPPMSVNTCAYMAPEQWCGGPVSEATDQYSLAASVYEMLTGKPPFPAPSVRSLRDRILYDPLVPSTTMPREAHLVFLQALDKEPGERFPDCMAFARALRDAFHPPAL